MAENERYSDFATLLPNLEVRCVFDVGANVGETVDEAARQYPEAIIHGFEPVTETFQLLSRRFAGNARIHCHQFALGSEPSEALITARGTATGNRIVSQAPKNTPVERIAVRAGDECPGSAPLRQMGCN
jgi:FkbM family methyltransferase